MPTDGFAFHFSADASFTGKSVWIETGTVTFVNHHANDTVNFGEQVDFTIGAGASVLFKGPGNFSSASNFRNWQGQVIVDESLFNFTTDVGAGSLVTIKVQNGGSLDLGGHKASNFSYELNNGTLKDGRLGARMPTTVKSKGGTIDGVVSVQDATDLTAVIAESGTTNLTGTSTFGAVTVKDTSTLTLYTDVGQTLKLKTLTVDAGGTLIIGANGKGATVQSDNDGSTVLNVSLGGTVKFDAAQGVNLTDNNLKFGDKANDKGSLVKTGAGGLVLSTQHSYTGDTTIESGTLVLGSDDVLARSSKVTVGNGATFDLGTKSQTTDQLILDSGTLKNGAFKGAISSKSGTIADLTANSLAELTAETGTTTLNGANVFKSILVKDGATLLSNDPTKTTTVNDNVTFEANSTYKVAITKDNFLTSLDIKSGSLNIDGSAKLIVDPRGDGFAIGQTYIIAKTSGGINRAFANDNVTLLTLVNMKATTTLVNGNKDLQVNLVSNVAQAPAPQTVDLYWVGGNAGDTFTLSNWKKDSYQGASLNSMGAPVASINFNKDATVTGDLPNATMLTVNIDTGKTVTLTGLLMNQDATTKSSLTVTGGTLIIATNAESARLADENRILSGAITIRHNATLQLGNTDANFNITLGVINSSQFLNDGTLTLIKPRDVVGNSYNFSVWDSGEILRSANATGTDGKFVIRGGVALKLTDAFKINQDMVVITARNDANNQKKFSILELGDFTTAPVVRLFAVGGILRFNNATEQSITTTISDWTTFTGDVVKLGAGQLNLTGAHTYTGTTRIEGGTLKLMTADAIKNSSDVSVLQNGTLDLNNLAQSFKALQVSGGTLRNGIVTITGNSNAIISNGGTFTNVTGGANLQVNGGPDPQHIYKTMLTGANTFGALTIAANAELLIVHTGERQNLFKSVTINEGGVLRMGNGKTVNSNLGNADSVSQTVVGQITPVTIKNGGTVYVNYGPNADYGADDLGSVIEDLDATHKGRLVKEGIGYFLLKRQHRYTGDTVITGGSLVLKTNNALHRSSKIIITNGTFRLDGNTQTSDLVELGADGLIWNGNVQGSTLIGSIDATGGRVTDIIGGATLNVNANTVEVTGTNTFGAITIKNGAILRVTGNTTDSSITLETGATLQLGDGTTNGLVSSDISDKGAVIVTTVTNTAQTYNGIISGTGNFFKRGAGSFTLSKSQTYTGLTTLQAGTLVLGADDGIKSGNFIVVEGGTLDLGTKQHTLSVSLNGGTTLTNGTLRANSAINVNGNTTLDNTITPLTIKNGGTIYLNYGPVNVGADDMGSIITDLDATHKGSLVKEGAGFFYFYKQHSYTGDTRITAGSVKLLTDNAFSSRSKIVISNATLDLDVKSQTSDLVELGAGGNITMSYGGKLIAHIDATGGRLEAVAGGSSLNVKENLVQAFGGNKFGAITIRSGATLQVINTSIVTSLTIDSGGKLLLGNVNFNGSVTSDISNEGAVIFNNIGPQLWNKIISGKGSLTRLGTGTLTIQQAQTYTGATTITDGALLFGLDQALSSSSAITITGGALDLSARQGQLNVTLKGGTLKNGTLNAGSILVSNGGAIQAITATGIDLTVKLPSEYLGIYALSGEGLRQGLAQLSGEVSTGAQTSAFTAANRFMRVASDPLNLARQREAVSSDTFLWGALLGGVERIAGDSSLGAGRHIGRSTGFAVGADHIVDAETMIGVSVAGASSNWNTRGMGTGTMESFQLAAYGRRSFGGFDVTGSFGFGQHWIGTDRTSFNQHGMSADFTGQTVSARVELGYKLADGWRGFVAFQGQRFGAQGYTEKGGAGDNFILTMGDQSGAQGRVELGARYEDIFRMPDGRQLFLRSQIAWARSHSSTPDVNAGLAALVGSRFTVSGTSAGPDALALATSFDLPLSNALSVGARVDGEWTNNSRGLSGQASVSIRW